MLRLNAIGRISSLRPVTHFRENGRYIIAEICSHTRRNEFHELSFMIDELHV